MLDLSMWMMGLLFLTGLAAGFVDSIAGGGGIITIPVLLSVGIPPHLALGTNKLQSSFGSLSATINYTRKGLVSFRETILGICFTAIGAMIGTLTVALIPQDILGKIIPWLLVGVFIFTLARKELGLEDQKPRMQEKAFYIAAGLAIGFYDGAFGPGTGTFWMIALVTFLGFNLRKATGYTKGFNFTSNLVALIVFAIQGQVLLVPGLLMGVGQWIGATLGSNFVMKSGVKFIRVVFLLATGATIARLLWTMYFAS